MQHQDEFDHHQHKQRYDVSPESGEEKQAVSGITVPLAG